MPTTTYDLSSASAEVNNGRMMTDAARGTRHPPRPPAPLSAREADISVEEAEEDDLVVPTTTTAPVATTPGSSSKLPNDAQTVRTILEHLDRIGSLHAHTTAEERAYIRHATCHPNASLERSLQSHPMQSLVCTTLAGVVLGCLIGTLASAPASGYRSSGASGMTSSCKRAVDRMLVYA